MALGARTMPAPVPAQRVVITSPEDGVRLVRDLETPAEMSTLALEAIVDPPMPELTWYVDGAPLAIAAHPYSARWRLAPGAHRIQARLAGGAMSRAVRVIVD
jgi:penicillin-binding protein 1C